MKRLILRTAMCLALTAFCGLVQADNFGSDVCQNDGCQKDCCQKDCCDDYCKGGSGGCWSADVELMFLKYHESDGVGTTAAFDSFDYELAPRITLAYDRCDGVSYRLRYFEFDHSAIIEGDNYAIDTYNLDFEVAQEIQLGCATSIEFNSGVRYNNYKHFDDTLDQSFDGIGIMVGTEVTRCTGNGRYYARARHAVLMGDGENVDNGDFFGDQVLGQTELATGFEVERCLCNGAVVTMSLGGEVQQWHSYEDEDEDVGFAGVVLGFGFRQ